MSVAVAEHKNLHTRWRRVQTERRRLGKVPRKRQEASPARRAATVDSAALFKTAADTFARGVLVLVIGYALFHAYLYLTSSSRFAVSEVTVEGLSHLDRAALLKGAPPVAGQNLLLLDIQELARRLTAHPWVLTAAVQRKWPNTVSIQIRERRPYARIQLDRIYVMDNFGVLVDEDGEAFPQLPLITGAPVQARRLGERVASDAILNGLRAMHYLNRLAFFRNDPVFAVRVSGPRRLTFSTRDRGLKIRMATDAVQEGFQNLKIILDALQPTGKGVAAIDLSFRNKVVIQPHSGGARRGHLKKT